MGYRAAIITISDRSFHGERKDLSGPALTAALNSLGVEVVACIVVPDDRSIIASTLQTQCIRTDIHLVMTTGGTGLAARDVTPEATRDVIEKPAPGISELLRQAGGAQTPLTWLSRGEAGTANGKLIINLPGNPKAMAPCIDALKPILFHALDLLNNKQPH